MTDVQCYCDYETHTTRRVPPRPPISMLKGRVARDRAKKNHHAFNIEIGGRGGMRPAFGCVSLPIHVYDVWRSIIWRLLKDLQSVS